MDRGYLNRKSKSKFKALSKEELKLSIEADLANESTDEEFLKSRKDDEKLSDFFGDELLNCDDDQEWIPEAGPSKINDSDPTPISNNNDLEFIDATPDPSSSENETDVNLNSKRKRKFSRKRKSKVSRMNTGFILETESGQVCEDSDDFQFDLQDGPSTSQVTHMEKKKLPVTTKIDNNLVSKKRKKLKKVKKPSKNHNAAKKKTKKLVNPLVDRINQSIEDLINTPSTSKTKEKIGINKSIPNDINLSIPETDFEDNSTTNQSENETVQNKNELNSNIQARGKTTIHNSSSINPNISGNISQENPDQIEVISIESPESENQNQNWKKLLNRAREKTTTSKSKKGKPPKKANSSKKTRKVIPLDVKLCIIKMSEDGGSNTKIARDKG